jgi:hypothetical protein
MTTPLVDLERPLRLHPLTYLAEGDEVTVGRADISSFGLFPVDGAELLRHLEAGHAPSEAARWYAEQYGEQVDIAEFIEVLQELELLVADGETVQEAAPVKWQRLGRALFSPAAWTGYALIVAATIAAMIHQTALVPTYHNLFFTHSSLVLLMLGIALGQVPWMLVHESFHMLAGRRLGLPSSLRIGRRFYYIVFVTNLDGLVSVPRRKRYLPMVAGMVADVLVLSVLTLSAAALHGSSGFAGLVYRLLLSMAFGVVLRLAWQFYFFLRTDLYYMVITVLGCNDLQATANQLLRNRFWRLVGRPAKLVDESAWHPRDAAVARWYSWLMVAGYALVISMLVTTAFPVGLRLTEQAIHELTVARSVLTVGDVLAFLALNFWEPVLAAALAVRAFRRRRSRKRSRFIEA